jgi:Na+/H+-dicarboxylate symporter
MVRTVVNVTGDATVATVIGNGFEKETVLKEERGEAVGS